jgi:hypothetical protein
MGVSAARGSTAPDKDSPHALAELLRRSRFEVLPLDGVEDEVLEHLPTDTKVTVTASPSRAAADLDRHARLCRFAKLVRISMKIGMGESARFLRHNRNVLTRIMTRQFKPSRLLEGLAQVVTDPDANVGGFHLYTFNEVARTERWRRQTLQRLGARP